MEVVEENIFDRVCSIDNLNEANIEARKNKKKKDVLPYGIRVFDKRNVDNCLLIKLHEDLVNFRYVNPPYKIERRKTDHKWRDLYKIYYYPGNILHHAIMRVISPYLIKWMSTHTFAGIEGRGTTQAADMLKSYLQDVEGTKFFLQEDVVKFYQTGDQDVIVDCLGQRFKDERFMRLMSQVIHHTPSGMQIGFFISQLIMNYLYTPVDNLVVNDMECEYYVRFCDDMVTLSDDKYKLIRIHEAIKDMVENVFHQKLHEPILARVGYEVKNENNHRKRRRGC